jgi:hypothetical protein
MKFLGGMFAHRRGSLPAPETATPEPSSPAALAQHEREAEEARRDEDRKQASADEIRRACEALGAWFPTDTVALPGMSRRSMRARAGDFLDALRGRTTH